MYYQNYFCCWICNYVQLFYRYSVNLNVYAGAVLCPIDFYCLCIILCNFSLVFMKGVEWEIIFFYMKILSIPWMVMILNLEHSFKPNYTNKLKLQKINAYLFLNI